MSVIQDRKLVEISIDELRIPSEKVAHVQLNNPLEHALLVLVKSGYSAVPVLDASYKFVGVIGKTVILNQILGLENFEIEKLSEMKVKEVMDRNTPTLTRENTLLDGLNAVIDHTFICLIDDEGFFDGILTRRAILKEIKKNIYINSYKK
ncbi:cyclic-di-AMP-binding protein CbpB [Oceanobacillus longus]|uniref:Cyclic-di-AMP-binding protein CbpB n=1 Tax=Oceanobacillus longus TaxID=930120 RepID=A0ABV8H002_9BACI